VPEPSSIVSGFLGLLGVSGVCLYHRRRQRA
jgi:PEP-CTERM motif